MENATAMTVEFTTINRVEMHQGEMSANDQPLPIPVSFSLPPLQGYTWPTGTILTVTFGLLAPEDTQYLQNLAGTTGTLTVYVSSSGWRRIPGTFSWSSPTLSLTLTTALTLEPWVTPI